MMLRGSILILFLLMSSYSYSQAGYPKIVVLGNDVVVAITKEQMKQVNDMRLSLQECKEINDSVMKAVDSCSSAFTLFHNAESELKQQIKIRDESISEKQRVIEDAIGVVKGQNNELRRLKTHRTILGISSGVLIGVVAYLLILL